MFSDKRIAKARSGEYERILNCVESIKTEDDWQLDRATETGLQDATIKLPEAVNLHEPWWQIRDQKNTGACVGFATADGVLRWHYTKKGLINEGTEVSPRFIWMANKETDTFTAYPSTFIESVGTQTKLALAIARKFGCALEADLPMEGPLYSGSIQDFYYNAARFRIIAYQNLGTDLQKWRYWIATNGPILTRLSIDSNWLNATSTGGELITYDKASARGGHAVAIVGYDKDGFIIRNSWGTDWGDSGFAHASNAYSAEAFTETYGAVL